MIFLLLFLVKAIRSVLIIYSKCEEVCLNSFLDLVLSKPFLFLLSKKSFEECVLFLENVSGCLCLGWVILYSTRLVFLVSLVVFLNHVFKS